MKKFTPAELTRFTGRTWNATKREQQGLELCFDSREMGEGKIFWPIIGEKFDAHHFSQIISKN